MNFLRRMLVVGLLNGWSAGVSAAVAPEPAAAIQVMKRGTKFMVENVGCEGVYVWSYLPDLSRRWGEMEATKTMGWLQGPGTLSVGHVLLDAYHATRDEYYYDAAQQTARALMRGQHPAGGWNYMIDLAGEESLRRWYDTIGKNGWRLEEFQHYYGNATFDDETTQDAAKFMLRFYLEKHDPAAKASLDRAIEFVLKSQYSNGGWPQRYPPAGSFSKSGNADYTAYITFNDNVAGANIEFLLQCYAVLGESRLLEPIQRAMNAFIITRQPPPQAGWGLQHTTDLKPAAARTYEPKALVTSTTGANIDQLLKFHALTGDRKFLTPIPDALAWLDAVRLPANLAGPRGTHPTFVEPGTNKPLFVHRTGSNVINGRYFVNDNPQNTVGHYSSFRTVNGTALRERYETARTTLPDQAMKNSPLRPGAPREKLPRIVGSRGGFFGRGGGGGGVEERAAQAIAALNAEGYWPSSLRTTSHPYKGDGPKEVAPGDFSTTNVGDEFDTSPYPAREPVAGISVATYTANMGALIRFLESKK